MNSCAILPLSWLQVFRRSDASRVGEGGREEAHTRAVPSEKWVVCCRSTWDRYALITAFFSSHTPDERTALLAFFSYKFNRLEKFKKLATSSRVCGPYTPARQTALPSLCSFFFNGLQRFPQLATSLYRKRDKLASPLYIAKYRGQWF
jgi:hypothetical protein